jgi:hypothetical protein
VRTLELILIAVAGLLAILAACKVPNSDRLLAVAVLLLAIASGLYAGHAHL